MRQLKITKSITNRESQSLDKYLQDIGREELITAEEEVELARKIKAGDQKALEKLTRANLRFVVSVAKQYQNQGLGIDDLISEGNLGLLKAAERFNYDQTEVRFLSYAVWWIKQSIIQSLHDNSRMIRLPINVINDDVIFKPSDMLVAEWPARIGKVEVDEGEFVLQGNVVLSLTEPQFTITMKVSPTDRAELEVGQAVSVDLKVGGQILPGVISELNDSANVGAAGEELYAGTITVTGDFSAVDGATVSIDVTLAEALQVLAVPVAAVLRSADGDEVRIVNDAGTITRVKVTIGLIDGEWVEIKDGLKGDELVVVDIAAGNVASAA